ncbi:transposase [Nocardioides nitrophenolicus]|uniref:transposase n=1 Tax=Nocardioides nitrophenolicus TaxID=60489 RepID=UPI000AA531D7|nr:transposase [Nocardioides nitrophenolicus]MBM7519207.1 transposase-like protein [Nocardioides nitrophenolicus]
MTKTDRRRRRRFSYKYKARIVAAIDAAPRGSKLPILVREDLDYSHIRKWRGQLARPESDRMRRRFTDEYKHAIVAEYDAAPRGTRLPILVREDLAYSHIRSWRRQFASSE